MELTSDTNWELGGGGGKMGIETLLVLAALFISVVAGVVFMTQGQRAFQRKSRKARARSTGLWWHSTVSSASCESSGCHADHFCKFVASFSSDAVSVFAQCQSWEFDSWESSRFIHPRSVVPLQCAVRRSDLFLLLFLDGNHV